MNDYIPSDPLVPGTKKISSIDRTKKVDAYKKKMDLEQGKKDEKDRGKTSFLEAVRKSAESKIPEKTQTKRIIDPEKEETQWAFVTMQSIEFLIERLKKYWTENAKQMDQLDIKMRSIISKTGSGQTQQQLMNYLQELKKIWESLQKNQSVTKQDEKIYTDAKKFIDQIEIQQEKQEEQR